MKIRNGVVEQIITHVKGKAPIEACGYLATKGDVIVHAYELTNVDDSTEHFSFDPKEQFSAVKDARLRGLEITAVYHSHPASSARPSEEDIRLAFDPDKIYVIVSLLGGQDVRAFRIKNGCVEIENVEVVDGNGI